MRCAAWLLYCFRSRRRWDTHRWYLYIKHSFGDQRLLLVVVVLLYFLVCTKTSTEYIYWGFCFALLHYFCIWSPRACMTFFINIALYWIIQEKQKRFWPPKLCPSVTLKLYPSSIVSIWPLPTGIARSYKRTRRRASGTWQSVLTCWQVECDSIKSFVFGVCVLTEGTTGRPAGLALCWYMVSVCSRFVVGRSVVLLAFSTFCSRCFRITAHKRSSTLAS